MSATRITLSYEQLRAIARYEMTFRDVLGDQSFADTEFSYPQPYAYTLEDLRCVVSNLKKAVPDGAAFTEDWFGPVRELAEAFGLCDILRTDDNLIPEGFSRVPPFNLTDNDCFADAWSDLEYAWETAVPGETIDIDYDQLLEAIDRGLRNRGKPIEEREYSFRDKRNFIRLFDDGKLTGTAAQLELMLCRRFVEELCEKDDEAALRVKGYSCYGGDRLYPCDWHTSRACISRLYEKTDDPQYANTLGYIYYYGRCNDGIPEYDLAFRYYSVAAASGLYEGMYKLADMLRHGYGCIKSPGAARTLYTMVYTDSLNSFLQGEHANFADIALRMGNVYAKGIGLGEGAELRQYHYELAYSYYLQAQYASGLRIKDSDFFGYRTVAAGIENALAETRAKLPGDYFTGNYEMLTPESAMLLAQGGCLCELTRELRKDGTVWLKASRITTQREQKVPYVLVCYPSINLCERVRKIALEICDEKETRILSGQHSARYDYVKYNERKKRTEFYNQGTLTAWIAAKGYRLHGKRRPAGAQH